MSFYSLDTSGQQVLFTLLLEDRIVLGLGQNQVRIYDKLSMTYESVVLPSQPLCGAAAGQDNIAIGTEDSIFLLNLEQKKMIRKFIGLKYITQI